ncbi:acyl-CoA dehydrogenase C-terminal domain-containing protein [Bradyrhizobium sp. G127]|uniref:acyl-CoA dehydrogenase C-terminal domain-containing protein n=1 Tax=Bradyrhizobium sp. G127 TaxID=2904800 RepID=UPI001F1B8ACF|nr:acyl-CoA dehydrogenase C-terminal domain-containing protein [Bradyrhizobium sp. G127]MCF2524841.1 acyl-CoA dehydrogenase C-terminal domain-containing protein [Bradyrhizobium sp. G127]
MPIYKAPVEDYLFVLHDLLGVQDMDDLPGFSDLTSDLTRPVLEGIGQFCEDIWQPLNQSGDEEGCRLENGTVRTPAGFADAYKKYCEAGWNKLSSPEKFGGAGLPGVIGMAAGEIAVGSNAALALYSGLTNAALSTLEVTGAPWMLQHILPKMVDGAWTGTMCLTEPHCGTDLRLMKTKAIEQPDGTYRITGTKIFISGGDHDLSENIIHLVLAKLPNAEGKFVDDLSTVNFFLVSKQNIDPDTGRLSHRNGVTVGAVEKKMGIKGNATCVLNFEDAVAYRLGGQSENKSSSAAGMSGMFLMMNRARLGTGISALAVSEAAYQNSAHYARERIAGKPGKGSTEPHAIVSYPDVRRLLVKQRAFNEGARAFGAWVSLLIEKQRHAVEADERKRSGELAQLLTPVIKAYFSDRAFDGANATVQIYGGHGYVRDNGVEQFVRDARIYQIYEGANGVQAHDLVARKLAGDDRAVLAFIDEIDQAIEKCNTAYLRDLSEALSEAAKDLKSAADWVKATSGSAQDVAAASYDILNIFGTVAIGMIWAKMAHVAQDLLTAGPADKEFLERKLVLARYWMQRELPMTRTFLNRATLGSRGLMDLATAAF